MSRFALPVFLFLSHIALVTALMVVLVRLMGASREAHASEDFHARSLAASPCDLPQPPPDAMLCPPEKSTELSHSQDGTRVPSGKPVSDDALETPASPAPAPAPDQDAPAASTAGAQVAPLRPDNSAPDTAAPLEPVVQAPSGDAVQPTSGDQVAALQQLVAQSRQENEQLAQIDNQLTAQEQQMARAESRRQSEALQNAAQHSATLASLGTLRLAEAVLASGSSDGVDDELSTAESALSGRTRLDVDAAREALARGDLYQAGLYLVAALGQRRALR
jgi:hypothetical protein